MKNSFLNGKFLLYNYSQARNQRCNEMRLDRQLLQRILDTWKKIKDIRRTNGYITTPVRLLIKQFVLFFDLFFLIFALI